MISAKKIPNGKTVLFEDQLWHKPKKNILRALYIRQTRQDKVAEMNIEWKYRKIVYAGAMAFMRKTHRIENDLVFDKH